MKKVLIITFVTICCFVNFAFTQQLSKPELIGTWRGGEDFREFLYHKTQRMAFDAKENPSNKIVARICSKDKDILLALMSSVGFAYDFLSYTQFENIPNQQVFLAISSKCVGKSSKIFEEYWVVPRNTNLEYDEIILAEKVNAKRFLVGNYENYESQPARKEFNGYLEQFIKNLKDNPKSEGFIVSKWNSRKTNRNIQKVLQQIRKEKIDVNRVRVVRKKTFYDLYPELFTITINK